METWYKIQFTNHRGEWRDGFVFTRKESAKTVLDGMRRADRYPTVTLRRKYRIKPFKVGPSQGKITIVL